MSRPLRIEYPGALFHVTSRGNERRPIFLDDSDRSKFLELLGRTVNRFKWLLVAYALMPNHFHLFLQLTAETLSRGMQRLNGSYVQFFNKRHARVGHLLQGRYDAPLVEKESYFLNLLRYVVRNPVRANIVSRPEDYEWTSYRATAGLSPAPDWLDVDTALAPFGDDRSIAQARYARFVMDTADNRCPWDDLVGQMYLGSDAWVRKTRERVESRPRDCEHPRVQRHIEREMSDVVSAVAAGFNCASDLVRSTGVPRMVAAWIATYDCVLKNVTIAAGLRLRSSGQISRLVQRCDQLLVEDVSLRSDVDRCRARLHAL